MAFLSVIAAGAAEGRSWESSDLAESAGQTLIPVSAHSPRSQRPLRLVRIQVF